MIAAQEGYIVSVLSAHESPLDNMNIMLSRGIDGNDITVEQSGYDAADALLRRGVPFTGVFAVNDRMAIGAMLMYQLLEKLHPDRSSPCRSSLPRQNLCSGKAWVLFAKKNKAKPEYRGLLQVNFHGPCCLCANMPPRNFPEWYAAFNIKKTNSMYLVPSKRVVIW